MRVMSSDNEEDPLQKRPMRTTVEAPSVTRSLDFEEPQPEELETEPHPDLQASPAHTHSSTHTNTSFSPHQLTNPHPYPNKVMSVPTILMSPHLLYPLHTQLNLYPHPQLNSSFFLNSLNPQAKYSLRSALIPNSKTSWTSFSYPFTLKPKPSC